MKAYFLNVPNEEKENILNQHKNVYDGYVTNNLYMFRILPMTKMV